MSETHRRVLNLVVRGRLEGSSDDKGFQLHEVSLLARESKANVERFQQYGFTGNPMPGSEVLLVFPGGNREHGLIVGADNRASRPTSMAPGEVAIYSDEGDAIALRRGNCAQIVTHTFHVDAGTAVVIETDGPVHITAQSVTIDAPTVTINSADVQIKGASLKHNGVNIGSTHTHSDPQGGSVGPPK